MPTFVHGKDAGLLIDSTAGTLVSITGSLTNIDFPLSKDAAELRPMGQTWVQSLPGMAQASVSLTGIWSSTIDNMLYDHWINDTQVTVEYGPASTVTGASNPKYSGEFYVSSYSPPSDSGSENTFTAELILATTAGITRGSF